MMNLNGLKYRVPAIDRPEWYAQDRDFKRHFGLEPKTKWPDQGMDAIHVNGVTLWVDAKKPGGKHRLKAMCPGCKRIFSGGTFHQHVRTVHKD